MRMYDLLEKKKRGEALDREEIFFLVQGITDGSIPDYQLSAFTMAVCFQGMGKEETAILTDAMAKSGDQVDLSAFGEKTVDKHSTGGVGDKTTLIVAPLVASLGGVVAKMSGRGLGHTGGTVDKLESIPRFRVELSPKEFSAQVQAQNIAVVGQSGNLAPADKKLYALRDVTATVDSIPLIASSIMSKKLAAGAKSIVLDVKCGSGAFMKTKEDAMLLAQAMVEIGRANGRQMAALITDMDRPLGFAIGNALEVEEAIAILKGEGPEDLREVALALAAEMLSLCNGWSREEALEKAEEALRSGLAYRQFEKWIKAQGGDLNAFLESREKKEWQEWEVCAPESGRMAKMDTEKIGIAAMLLGAGRTKKEDALDYDAGIHLLKKTGEYVEKGEGIARLYAKDSSRFEAVTKCFLDSIYVKEEGFTPMPAILGRIGGRE